MIKKTKILRSKTPRLPIPSSSVHNFVTGNLNQKCGKFFNFQNLGSVSKIYGLIQMLKMKFNESKKKQRGEIFVAKGVSP